MTFAPICAVRSPVLAGAPSHGFSRPTDSILSAGKHAVRHFCEGSTK
jgi:hypothetical protein